MIPATMNDIILDPVVQRQWIGWLEDQLHTTNQEDYTQTGVNRVFLTEKDDVDIARHIMANMLVLLKDRLHE